MFGKKKTEEPVIAAEPVIEEPAAREPEPIEIEPEFVPAKTTVIAPGVTMVGDFITQDPMEIRGEIRGNVISEKSMHIFANGKLTGDAKVLDLSIDGKAEGKLIVDELTTLSDTGAIKGSLKTSRFSSAPGSSFSGNFSMEPKAAPVKEPEPAPKAVEEPQQTE